MAGAAHNNALLTRPGRALQQMQSAHPMVQVLVHVRPADTAGKTHFELLECETHTSIQQVKQQVEQLGKQSETYDLPAASQELVFMGQRCQDSCTLADYGICATWIAQVTGFVVNPDQPGRRFVEGVQVPC